ncbi:surfeit locus protein 1 [Orussus abietinus]|uniref:surfeit locus protein 1 n=1 Tax=Orussus abietinus TaxID=222816 RepID=UPI0006268AA0|nr:surfeit locus protein 1 [Orussus abietinus]
MNFLARNVTLRLANASWSTRGTQRELILLIKLYGVRNGILGKRLFSETATRNYRDAKHSVFSASQAAEEDTTNDEPIGIYGFSLLAIPIVTFILGTWQVQRLKWKTELMEKLKLRTSAEPQELPEDLFEIQSMEYYPIKVKGRFLYDKEFLVGPKSLTVHQDGNQGNSGIFSGKSKIGNHVITPFKVENRNITILVNRGWVPKNYKVHEELSEVPKTVEITGLVRSHETRPPFLPHNSPGAGVWYYRDLNAMAELTGAAPVMIDMVANDTPSKGAIGGQTIVNLRNEHFSYIVTWYSLSAVTSYFWFRQFIQKRPLL